MIWKHAMKYPVLVVGIILFVLFLTNPKTKEYWGNHTKRFIPNTCEAVKDRFYKFRNRTIHQETDKLSKKEQKKLHLLLSNISAWELECPGTQLLKLTVMSRLPSLQKKTLKSSMLKELANTFYILGYEKNANHETLEKLKYVEVTLKHPMLTLHAKTDGLAVVEISRKKSPKDIAQHLKLTVKIKEL